MVDKAKKLVNPKIAMPQIALLFSQLLFLVLLVGGFSLISQASFMVYERSLSPIYVEGAFSSFHD